LGRKLPTARASLSRWSKPKSTRPSGAYFIDPLNNEFSAPFDPSGIALTLVDGSGSSGAGISNHAQAVGAYYFGNLTSIAPAANNLTLYEANNWLSSVLRYNSTNTPVEQNFRVQNHSWVGTTAPVVGGVVPPALHRTSR
jgi:hypothetical protein